MPAKSGKKNRKIGRTKRKPTHQRYNAKNKRFWNKVRRVAKYWRKFPQWKPYNLSSDVRAEVIKLVGER